MFCTVCGATVAETAQFCAKCGTRVESDANATTLTSNPVSDVNVETLASVPSAKQSSLRPVTPRSGPRATPSSSNPLLSSDSVGGGRFVPGAIVAERYRIVALLGRGGMGEVYRAEDLKLSQVVAIKFLPESLSRDAAALARFHSEVRVARHVSHPNVCRVFDIGDEKGIPFLSMEYVDGEDLSSLIRRIGRLPQDKATEVSRQICAGLAAAHERGVVHRDLKPSNVMLDGAGKARITDFGLASVAASIQGAEARAGTPAYMAPEQLAGNEVTFRSDIYSLGLVMYEVLTGRRAFAATTLPELMKAREEGTVTNPSALVKDLDPVIERVILRCLEKEPAKRPSSALQVAAALPGGDPLAAALAAGETPSPEMVAASGETEGLQPWKAVSLFAVVVLVLICFPFLADRFKLNNLVPMENPPEVLRAHVRTILQDLGYTQEPEDVAYGFQINSDYLNYVGEHDKRPDRWKYLSDDRPASLVFWYRQSPRELVPENFWTSAGGSTVTPDDPQQRISAMVFAVMDLHGRLLHLEVIPPQQEQPSQKGPSMDWSPLFAAAGLAPGDYKAAQPEWTALLSTDSRVAWTGTTPGHPDIAQRLEGASFQGKPVYFDVLYPWSRADRQQLGSSTPHQKAAAATLLTLFVGVLVASAFVAYRNLKLGRGDTKGAARLGSFTFLSSMAVWLLCAHHVWSSGEVGLFVMALSWAVLITAFTCTLYLAIEPYARKRASQLLVSWSRLLAGQLRDPVIGRDLLIGAAYGVCLTLFEISDDFLLPLFGKLPPAPSVLVTDALNGVRYSLGALILYVLVYVLYGLVVFFLLFLLRLVVKKEWIAAVIVVFLGAATNTGGDYPMYTFFASALIWISILLILKRFGFLAMVVGLVVQNVLIVFPVTSHLSRWYASEALTGILAIAAIAVYGFRTSLAGKPLFSG
jgi:serine/threonine protein kinase